MKCHSVSAKEGPSFKDTAAKYKGKPDAEKALTTFLTTNPKVKVDGKEEMHDAPKTNDQAQVTNLVKYILFALKRPLTAVNGAQRRKGGC